MKKKENQRSSSQQQKKINRPGVAPVKVLLSVRRNIRGTFGLRGV